VPVFKDDRLNPAVLMGFFGDPADHRPVGAVAVLALRHALGCVNKATGFVTHRAFFGLLLAVYCLVSA